MANWWAPIDVDFLTNGRIMAAGRNGRDVYLALVLLHKKLGGDGVIKAGDMPAARPLAAQLQCSAADVREGLAACADPEVGLIQVSSNGDVSLLGWCDKWRGPKTSTERVRTFRAKRKETNGNDVKHDETLHGVSVGGGNVAGVSETVSPVCVDLDLPVAVSGSGDPPRARDPMGAPLVPRMLARYLWDAVRHTDPGFPHDSQPEEAYLREWAEDLVGIAEADARAAIDFAHRSEAGSACWKDGSSWSSVVQSGIALKRNLGKLLARIKAQEKQEKRDVRVGHLRPEPAENFTDGEVKF